MDLSIIIPAYNAGRYIERTILSIIDSIDNSHIDSHDRVEIIVVNDGSIDDTENVMANLTKQQIVPIKYIKQKNAGVSVARNNGLNSATGNYVYYMDADDCIEKRFMSVLLPLLHESYDLILFGYIKKKDRLIYVSPNCSHNDLLYSYLTGKTRAGIWSLVAKRSLYNDNRIAFKEGISYGEDIEVISHLFAKANNTKLLKDCLYVYDMTIPDSAMNKVKFNSKTVTCIKAMEYVLENCINSNSSSKCVKAAKNRLLTEYYVQKRAHRSVGDTTLRYLLEPYSYIEGMLPPMQMSRFYLFNIYNYLRCHFQF